MNVSWYYAVQGTRSGPLTWDQIRTAVETGKLGPDDLVWSPSFGKEWRKASLMTGLFPPPPKPEDVSPPGNSDRPAAASAENAPSIEILLTASEMKSPFAPKEEAGKAEDNTPKKVICLESLGRAWHNTMAILFTAFSPRRWFFLSLCLMLTMLSQQNPFAGLIVNEEDSASARQIKRLGLEEVTQSGLFKWKTNQEVATLEKPAGNTLTNETAVLLLGEAMRDTSVALSAWFSTGGHGWHLFVAALGTLFMYAIGAWFSARGNAMLLARIYRPDDLIFATWIEADKPSATLFRGMLAIRVLSLSVLLGFCFSTVMSLASLPLDQAVTIEIVLAILTKLFLILLANTLLIGYVKDFVTPHIVLEDCTFMAGFALALRNIGFWFIRYLMLLALVYLGLAILLALVGSVFGFGGQLATVLIFTSPPFGALLTLPLHLLRRLWTLDIVFRTQPTLRSAVPKARIIRIKK